MRAFMSCDQCGKVLPNNELRFYVLASDDGRNERSDSDFCSAVCVRDWLADTYPDTQPAPVVPLRPTSANTSDPCPECGGSGLGAGDPATGLRKFCGYCECCEHMVTVSVFDLERAFLRNDWSASLLSVIERGAGASE